MQEFEISFKRKNDIEKVVSLAEKSLKLVMSSTKIMMEEQGMKAVDARIIGFYTIFDNGHIQKLEFHYLSKGAKEYNPEWDAVEVYFHMNEDPEGRVAYGPWPGEAEVMEMIKKWVNDLYKLKQEGGTAKTKVVVCG